MASKGNKAEARKEDEKAQYDCSGKDTDGQRYASISALWDAEAPGVYGRDASSEWYNKSAAYWVQQPASVEGMLGGVGLLHARDVAASRRFLASVSPHTGRSRTLHGAAGIGRVTKHLLLPLFATVDMLEQNASYLQRSKEYVVGPPSPPPPASEEITKEGEVGLRIADGMQDFCADGAALRTVDGDAVGCLNGVYDVVWIQWTIGYLTDDDFAEFVRQCVRALRRDDNAYSGDGGKVSEDVDHSAPNVAP